MPLCVTGSKHLTKASDLKIIEITSHEPTTRPFEGDNKTI
jgi:hypothetical protein